MPRHSVVERLRIAFSMSLSCVPGTFDVRAGLLQWWVFRDMTRGLILQGESIVQFVSGAG